MDENLFLLRMQSEDKIEDSALGKYCIIMVGV